jgi:hypothetical protein
MPLENVADLSDQVQDLADKHEVEYGGIVTATPTQAPSGL